MNENRIIRLEAENVDAAAKAVLQLLRQDTKTTSFWLHGWYGLGASSVLRAIARFLKSPSCDSSTRNHFGSIIHVDCSTWKSRRGMQKIIAEELGLQEVMPLFDKEDEDDDFRGVDESSRGGITSIGKAILQSLFNEKFLIIFQCGIDEEIIPEELSILLKFGSGKLLWTNCVRFQQFLENPPDYLKCACVISVDSEPFPEQMLLPLHEEAVEVAELIRYMGIDGINPDLVMECYCYLVFLIYEGTAVDYGWITHACNYWVCDGILQGDTAWKIGDALHGLLLAPLRYNDYKIKVATNLLGIKEKKGRKWISTGSCVLKEPNSCFTSYFLTKYPQPQELETDDFQQVKNLRVLKLYNCSFDFSSPPFIRCQNLRFLWLDTCTDKSRKEEGAAPPHFPNLWVFDLRFTEYAYFPQVAEMMRDLRELNAKGVSWKIIYQAWSKLQNLHRLRVTVEPLEVVTKVDCSSIDVQSLELLDLSGSTQLRSLPDVSLAEMLKMLVLDGCFNLKRVTIERAPMLEIFSFDGYGQAKEWTYFLHLPEQDLRLERAPVGTEAKVSKISLEGCARLHSIFLRALHNLQELNLSCTAIKRLGIDAMDVPELKSLFLLGCEKLRYLLWKGYRPELDVLRVDTTARETARSVVCCGKEENVNFVAEVTCLDGRFVWSALTGVSYRMSSYSHVHLQILDPSMDINFAEDTSPDNGDYVGTRPFLEPYTDINFPKDGRSLWDDFLQPELLRTRIEIGQGSHNLDSIDLQMAHCIWGKGWGNALLYVVDRSFERLQHLYLHNCPRLVYVLPVSFHLTRLETIQIERCGNLKCVFPLDDRYPSEVAACVKFSNLKRIKLQHLHSMEKICESRVLYAPELETVTVRDCWRLRRLPVISDQHNKRPVVQCEEDWWNKLEWDGLMANHHPSCFETRHSRNYKKTILRASVLR